MAIKSQASRQILVTSTLHISDKILRKYIKRLLFIVVIAVSLLIALVVHAQEISDSPKEQLEIIEVKSVSSTIDIKPILPIELVNIGRCESGNRQFDEKGEVLKGRVNSKDIGKYQINEFYHGDTAKKLGYDIYTEEGNTMYALWLYEKQGVKPWIHSAPCHGYY